MKIEVLFDKKSYGTIQTTKKGLVISGDTTRLQGIVDELKGDQTDVEFLARLPRRLHGRVWARKVN